MTERIIGDGVMNGVGVVDPVGVVLDVGLDKTLGNKYSPSIHHGTHYVDIWPQPPYNKSEGKEVVDAREG